MKQDRNGVRTAQDLERKYDLSSIGTLKKNYELQKSSLNKVENELNNFVSVTTQNIEELQNQVDGNITTWFSSGIPTLNNYPANEWEDDDTRNNHLGDLYYDRETGYAYRFTLDNNVYQWIDIKDTDVTQALALANAAQDTADSKRRVFVVQPAPPYDVGDLWLNNEELYRCQITKGESESYAERDWIKATKYTDDTVAYQVDGKLTILSGTVTEIRDDVDELSNTMTNTTRLVDEQGNTIGVLQEQQSSTKQTVNEISATVSSHGNKITSLEQTVEAFSVDLDIYNITIPVNTSNKPLENKTYQIGYYAYFKGSQVTPTVTKLSTATGITQTISNNKINLAVTTNTAITNLTNELSYRFDYIDNGETYSSTLKVLVVLAQKGEQGTQGVPGTNGVDGKTSYLHIKYSEDGTTFTPAQDGYEIGEKPSRWQGTYVDFNATDSTTFSDYDWVDTAIVVEDLLTPTQDTSGTSFYLEDSTNAELVNFEMEGKTTQASEPSPSNPSELVSVGYANLGENNITSQVKNGLTITKNDDGTFVINGTATANTYIAGTNKNINLSNGTYFLSGCNPTNNSTDYFLYLDGLESYKDYGNGVILSISNSTNTRYIIYVKSGTVLTNATFKPMVTKGTQAHNYIPYGKYVIEVKTTSKNLWDNKDYYTQLTTNNYTIENNGFTFTRGSLTGGRYIAKRITVEEGTTYTFSAISNDFNSNFYQIIYRGNVYGTNVASSTNGKVTYTATANEDLFFTFIISSGVQNASVSNIQVEKNSQATEFEPYYYKIYTYSLNQPLRSIGDVKDLLYIKNGMLYVDRKIGSKILNGSESWGTIGDNRYYTPFQDKRGLTSAVPCLLKSDYFMPTNNAGDAVNIGYMTEGYYTTPVINVFFNYNGVNNDLAGFKTWLSTHNTEVQYLLASSNTEELGQVDIPNTYKPITHIDTIDINEPNMNVIYVRDLPISNYVESQMATIKVNEDRITSRVERIENNGLEDRVAAVELQQTSTDLVVNVIKSNSGIELAYDEDGKPISGKVTEVTTTTGFTFNEDGLNIKKSDTDYNTLIDNTGTYYKDGETIISMTNKDGFLAKDFRLQGQHYYSYNGSIPSKPLASENYDFVDERIEVDGEYAYATFYNGEV